MFFLFVYEKSREPLNGFGPNSRGRRVWSLARRSLKVTVKGQGHQGQKVSFFGPFGGLRAVCLVMTLVMHLRSPCNRRTINSSMMMMTMMMMKTSLASSLSLTRNVGQCRT